MRRDFVANVSHELRTPLTVVSGYLETLLEDEDEAALRWRRTLQSMHGQSKRMEGIVEDLLTLSRLETRAQPEHQLPVAVPGLLAQVREDAQRLSGEQAHQMTLEADADLWLSGAESELRSLFSNLAFNAVRYTPAGGRIQMRWYADATGAHFSIQDTGIGIAAQHIPRLTERFYRVDIGRSRGSGGTGLGLAIVKHVLMRHDGQLEIDSQPGKGSMFRCDFAPGRIYRQTRSEAGAQGG
jgi:two-component system phosphate regulon sensor histidine kinase PhoR